MEIESGPTSRAEHLVSWSRAALESLYARLPAYNKKVIKHTSKLRSDKPNILYQIWRILSTVIEQYLFAEKLWVWRCIIYFFYYSS
jgi:hypothetical protein